jgi:hypothetical protein
LIYSRHGLLHGIQGIIGNTTEARENWQKWGAGVDFNPFHALHVWTDGEETHVQDLEDKDVWCYSNSKRIFWKIHWNIYLGYKLVLDAEKITHCMIANRITFKIVV